MTNFLSNSEMSHVQASKQFGNSSEDVSRLRFFIRGLREQQWKHSILLIFERQLSPFCPLSYYAPVYILTFSQVLSLQLQPYLQAWLRKIKQKAKANKKMLLPLDIVIKDTAKYDTTLITSARNPTSLPPLNHDSYNNMRCHLRSSNAL